MGTAHQSFNKIFQCSTEDSQENKLPTTTETGKHLLQDDYTACNLLHISVGELFYFLI
jgi:hypothetical protein